jgi:exosortase
MSPSLPETPKQRRLAHWPLLWTDRLTAWHAVAAVWMAAIAIVATGDVWADILLLARRDEEISHILLAPLVAVYLIWVRRQRLRYIRVRGRWIGVAMAAAGWLALSVGYARHMDGVWHGGAVLLAIGCVLSVLGAQVLWAFAPAVCVLALVVPVPTPIRQAIAVPLAGWSAHMAQVALQMLGVAATQSGNTLTVNGLCVNIAEACNGLRMVFALLLVCYAFCFSLPLRNSVRLLVLLASPAAALVCNVARILPTVWVYGYCSHGWGDRFHDVSGWLMLPMSFLLLLGLLKTMRWVMIPVTRYTLAG